MSAGTRVRRRSYELAWARGEEGVEAGPPRAESLLPQALEATIIVRPTATAAAFIAVGPFDPAFTGYPNWTRTRCSVRSSSTRSITVQVRLFARFVATESR